MSAYTNNTIGAVPRDNSSVAQPETTHAATVLDNSISRLAARVSELSQRLVPVLENKPQEKGGVTGGKLERQMFSPLGRGLIETSYRVEDIERQVNDLLENLAI